MTPGVRFILKKEKTIHNQTQIMNNIFTSFDAFFTLSPADDMRTLLLNAFSRLVYNIY